MFLEMFLEMIRIAFTQNATLPAKTVNDFLIKPKFKFNFCEAMFLLCNYLVYMLGIEFLFNNCLLILVFIYYLIFVTSDCIILHPNVWIRD